MARRGYAGGAKATRLAVGVDAAATTLVVEDADGWPDGTYPFFAVLERGTANEEKILVGQRNGNNLQNLTRGSDQTAAITHQALVTVEHIFTATDASEANVHVNATGAVHGTSSTVVGVDDTQTLKNKTIDAGQNTITGLTSAMIPGLDAEQDAQDAATAAVQTNLNAEASTRALADTGLRADLDSLDLALAEEASDRADADALKFDKAGGAISGAVTIGGTLAVTGATTVPTPTTAGHAATKGYVDTEVNKVVDVFYGTAAPPASGFKQGDVYLKYV